MATNRGESFPGSAFGDALKPSPGMLRPQQTLEILADLVYNLYKESNDERHT